MYAGIVVPTQEDLDFLDEFLTLNDIEESMTGSFVTRTGFIDNRRQDMVTLISSGIGKVNTVVSTQFLIDRGCTSMILLGTAGSLDENLNINDIIVPSVIMSHDGESDLISQTFPFEDVFHPDESMMNLLRECADTICPNVSYYSISSGDEYISDASSLFTIAAAVDMESYAFAQTCRRNDRPFIVIKSISNNSDILCYEESNDFARNAALLTAVFVFNHRDTAINLSSLHIPSHMLTTKNANVDLHPDWKIFTN